MDELNAWFNRETSTPIGSVLMFLAVFLFRIAATRWLQRREAHAKRRKLARPNA